jgi:hypothetical protein
VKCIVYFLSYFHLNSTHSFYDSPESEHICTHSSFHYFHPHPGIQSKGREYVQPQWVFDSINAQTLLPVSHLTPSPHQPCPFLLYSSKIPSITALPLNVTLPRPVLFSTVAALLYMTDILASCLSSCTLHYRCS